MNTQTDLTIINTVITGVKADNALTPQKIENFRLAQGLKAGTQILLADGSSKNIEEIQYGDIVQSWNWVDKAPISVKAYGAIPLDCTDHWIRYIFCDGLFIDVNTDAIVFNRQRGVPQLLSTWNTKAFGHSLTDERQCISWSAPYEDIQFSQSYILLTENFLYFANGILCGHMPHDLYKYAVLNKILNFTERDLELFTTLAKQWKNNELCRIGNPQYLLEASAINAKRNTHLLKENDINEKGCATVLLKQIKMMQSNNGGDKKKTVACLFKELHNQQITRIKAQKES